MAIDTVKIQEAEAVLISRSYALELYADHGPFKASSRDYMGSGTCPACGGDNFWISMVSPHCGCWRAECGYKAGWYQFLRSTRGYDWNQYARHVADAAGVDLELSPADEKQYQDAITKDRVLQMAQLEFTTALWAGGPELDYLRSRGYSDEQIGGLGAGAYRSQDGLSVALSARKVPVEYHSPSKSPDDGLDVAGLMTYGFGTSHTLTFPLHDATGRMLGFTVRSLLSDEERQAQGKLPKYLHSKGWQRKDGLPGMNLLRGQERVLMVESPIGQLLLKQYGIPAVAVAGLHIPPETFRQFKMLGVREVVFAYDNEEKSRTAKRLIISRLPKGMERDLSLFMATLPDGVKAPDDLCLTDGPEAVRRLFDTAQTYASWQGWDVMQDADLVNDAPRERAMRRACEGYDKLRDRDPIMAGDYLRAVMSEARHELDPADVEARITGRVSSVSLHEKLRDSVRSAEQIMPRLVRERMDETRPKPNVIPTGIPYFDNQIGGIMGGMFSLFVAPEKAGKSSCALAMAVRQASMGHRIGYLSLDMSADLTHAYLGSALCALANKEGIENVQPRDFLLARDRDKLVRFSTHLGSAAAELLIVTHRMCPMADVLAYIDIMHGQGAVEVVLDQAMFIREFHQCKSPADHIAICEPLIEAAERTGMSIRLLHQANRNSHGGRTRRKDIFGSSTYAQMADVLFLLTDKQSSLCESDKSPGFVPMGDLSPNYLWDCRSPRVRRWKDEDEDLADAVQDEPWPQRMVEIEMQGRVPKLRAKVGFDYVAKCFLE